MGAQNNLNGLAAGLYPTMARATGVGWALGMGRVGSIVGPVVGGQLLDARLSTEGLLLTAAVWAMAAAAAAFLLPRHVGRRETATPLATQRTRFGRRTVVGGNPTAGTTAD